MKKIVYGIFAVVLGAAVKRVIASKKTKKEVTKSTSPTPSGNNYGDVPLFV